MTFGLATYGLSLAAGLLSTLSPCVLPILPIVIGTALAAHRLGPFALAAGLVLSFTVVGLFVATIGYELGVDSEWFRTLAALVLMGFGLILLSDRLQARFSSATSALSAFGKHTLSQLRLQGLGGQLCVGLLLGLVWAPCVGPTLGAASALAAQGRDLPRVALVMVLFGFGAALPLLVLGAVSRTALLRFRGQVLAVGRAGKIALGLILLAFGLMIVSGLDKRFEAFLVEHSPGWLTELTTRY
jgi:cytochrome c biogenesis protein CcdA